MTPAFLRRLFRDPTSPHAEQQPQRSVARTGALWVSTVQGLLLLSWTLYVLFLPALAAQAGIPLRWVVWILVADQALFVLTDWACGVYADHLAKVTGRVGHAMVVAALVSAGLLAAMPEIAEAGHREALLLVIALWAVSSSFLRAPAFSLLGRIGGVSRKSGVVTWSLVGVSLAGAVGPLITSSLQRVDVRWSLGAASLALAAAGLLATRVERLQGAARPRSGDTPWKPVLLLSGLTFAVAFGMQMHTSFGAASSAAPQAKLWALPAFWSGFAVGLIPAARATRSDQTLRWCAGALLAGALAVEGLHRAADLLTFGLVQGLAGAAWAVMLTGALATTLRHGGANGVGSPLGVLLSALSLAAMARLVLVGLGAHHLAAAPLAVASMWMLAALGLVLHPWARRG